MVGVEKKHAQIKTDGKGVVDRKTTVAKIALNASPFVVELSATNHKRTNNEHQDFFCSRVSRGGFRRMLLFLHLQVRLAALLPR